MLTYHELAVLGFCPAKGSGYLKPLPKGWVMPPTCTDNIFKQLPLQYQIFYKLENVDGHHYLGYPNGLK